MDLEKTFTNKKEIFKTHETLKKPQKTLNYNFLVLVDGRKTVQFLKSKEKNVQFFRSKKIIIITKHKIEIIVNKIFYIFLLIVKYVFSMIILR